MGGHNHPVENEYIQAMAHSHFNNYKIYGTLFQLLWVKSKMKNLKKRL
jgi:hypothetical protein